MNQTEQTSTATPTATPTASTAGAVPTLDPRPLYQRALSWVHDLADGVRPDQLTGPTPCPEFDVRALLGHLVATVERARVIGEGGDPFAVPRVVTGLADLAWAPAYAEATATMWTVWSDERRLDASVTAPWGTIPGRAAMLGYLNETLVHGWDLAVATGQPPEADADLASTALALAPRVIPAEPRGGHTPFAPVVEPAPGAGPTERLANWSGHRR
ncbi:MAG TPA: TIGR03086 family metal-binding protein [Pseudonocardia sp.]|nr:TIGR03086 family metal-binding protein [Pseudonocardia sp.]